MGVARRSRLDLSWPIWVADKSGWLIQQTEVLSTHFSMIKEATANVLWSISDHAMHARGSTL